MKFVATILLLIIIGDACISAHAQNVTIWGNVHNTRILAEQHVIVTSNWWQIKERTVTYRSVSTVYRIKSYFSFFILLSMNRRMDRPSYMASCIWTIKNNHVSHHRSCKAEFGRILRQWELCRSEVTESIRLFASSAKQLLYSQLLFCTANLFSRFSNKMIFAIESVKRKK